MCVCVFSNWDTVSTFEALFAQPFKLMPHSTQDLRLNTTNSFHPHLMVYNNCMIKRK